MVPAGRGGMVGNISFVKCMFCEAGIGNVASGRERMEESLCVRS